MTTTIATVRQSPFRETEWDRRLDNMLEDLENSAAANSGGASCTTSSMQQHQSSSSANVSHQMVSHSASQSSSATQQQRSASSHRQATSSSNNNNTSGAIAAASDSTSQQNGYGSVLQKSKSVSSVQENTDSMLKEMDNALKASSNFIESHRSSSSVGPNSRSTTEYHEYKSYSNGGTRGGNPGGEFNLEKQVQHMMPPPSPSLSGLMQRSNQQ